MGQVANHAVVPDPGLQFPLRVDDRAVLDRRPSANDDRAIVGPDDHTGPDARARADADFADQDRLRVDVRLRMNPRPFLAQRIESHGAIQTAPPMFPKPRPADLRLDETGRLRRRWARSEGPRPHAAGEARAGPGHDTPVRWPAWRGSAGGGDAASEHASLHGMRVRMAHAATGPGRVTPDRWARPQGGSVPRGSCDARPRRGPHRGRHGGARSLVALS